MKLRVITIFFGLLVCTGAIVLVAAEKTTTWVARNFFTNDILGMDENDFRTRYHWQDGKFQEFDITKEFIKSEFGHDDTNLKSGNVYKTDFYTFLTWEAPEDGESYYAKWIEKYPRRFAIFTGEFSFHSIRDIDNALKFKKGKWPNPSFTILFYDPANLAKTDIRSILSHPDNDGAVYQLASTFFGPLEGGMVNYTQNLTKMLGAAAQGEEVSVATGGATIWRKYFMQNSYAMNGQPILGADYANGYFYLLTYLGKKAKVLIPQGASNPKKVKTSSWHEFLVDRDAIRANSWNPDVTAEVGVGLHQNVVVTLGQAERLDKKPSAGDKQEQLSIQQKYLDSEMPVHANLVFASAYNLRNFSNTFKKQFEDDNNLAKFTRGWDGWIAANQNQVNFSKLVLNASYEATVKCAVMINKRKIYLTLMGASAFSNKMQWLYEAMNRPAFKDLIKKDGLEIILIFRPEPAKYPIRDEAQDIEFLKNMFVLSCEINGISNPDIQAVNKLIAGYITQAYKNKSNPDPAQRMPTDIQNVLQLENAFKTGKVAATTPAPIPPKPKPITNPATLPSKTDSLGTLPDTLEKLQNDLTGLQKQLQLITGTV